MKKFTLLLFLAIGIKSVYANSFMCSGNGMQFYPEQKEISLNSMFIIQGYARSQKTINSFKNRQVYLKSESGELIELNLQNILIGQMSLTQAIFKPSQELKSNTTYYLKYSDQTELETMEMKQWNSEKKEREKIYWKTTDKKSMNTLNSNLNIEFKKTEVEFYGCGPSVYAIFKITNKSESEIWYKTEVLNISTNKKSVYYIKDWNEELNVGHGMCAGAFTFQDNGKYKVRFTPMNTDGKALNSTEWITFKSP
jgi:hypothetical protein